MIRRHAGKRKSLFLFFMILSLGSVSLNAEEKENFNPFSVNLSTDFAYYPESKCKESTQDIHFAGLTGIYSSLECRSTLSAKYTIKTPLGEHWLTKDANVFFTGAVEVTPVSVRPMLSAGFSPLPFIVLKGGASAGFAWNYLGLEGIAKFNKDSGEYETLSTINHPFYEFWAQSDFMFDTGALIPGEWTHLIMLGSFRIFYSGIAGLERHDIYEWQTTKNMAQGLQYEASGLLAYQMPLALYRAGIIFTAGGHFNGGDYGNLDSWYDGGFTKYSLSPALQFKLSAKDELRCLFQFANRRSFEQYHDKAEQELFMKTTGQEWYFQRIALSWSHRFL